MFEWMKQRKILILITILFLMIGIPFLIHILFKLKTNNNFFVAEWTAGEILAYYGAVLSFLSTVILSILALLQNEIIRKESNKHTILLEEMEIQICKTAKKEVQK